MAYVQIYGGAFQNGFGQVVANGTLTLQLSQDCAISGGSGQITSASKLSLTLDANGNVPQSSSIKIWGNDSLLPTGTVYYADLFDSNGTPVWISTQCWSITGANPVNLSALVPASSSVSYSGAVLLNPSSAQTISTYLLTLPSLTVAGATTTAGIVDSSSIQSPIFRTSTATPATAGIVRLANTDAVNWRNAGNSANQGLNLDSSNRLVNSADAGSLLTGSTPSIRLGGTSSSFPMFKRNSAAINVRLADDSADAAVTCAGLTSSGALSFSTLTSVVPNANYGNGIFTSNSATQSQVINSGTEYYVTSSGLTMPATFKNGIQAGSVLAWRIAMTKTAAGTGSFQILFKHGTNGSTADTTDATITIGTQTAVADCLFFDLIITFTSTTAYYYVLSPRQQAATATGFGLAYPAVASVFVGTVSGLTTTTGSTIWGLSLKSTTGTPTITVPLVLGYTFNIT